MANALKYKDIVDWTMKQLAAGVFKPKDKFLSEASLGEKFNCSRQTVRRALEELEKQGHITRFQGSGTYISADRFYARRNASGNLNMTVGLINTYMDNYVFPGIIRGIEGVLSEAGFGVELISTNNQIAGETRALQFMMERNLDGLIVEPTRSALPCANLDLYRALGLRGLPIVFIDSYYPELSSPYVALDDEKAGYEATKYLFSMGHRNISSVFPHSHRQGHLRYLGYVKAHADFGIPIHDDLVCWHSRENMHQMLHSQMFLDQLKRSTAVLCYNDATALTVIDFLHQKGIKVPEDLSVVGIDNSEMARITSLTSIAHPAERLGEAAAKLLLDMINGSEGSNVLFPPELVIRGSVRQLES